MRTSGIFKIHQQTIKCRAGEPVYLIPFGDVHRDSELFAQHEWDYFLAYLKRYRKGAHFLGMGDYLDMLRAHNRALLTGIQADAETIKNQLDKIALTWVETFSRELSFLRGSIIGMLGGNHKYDFPDGTDSDQQIARKLAAPYLGTCAAITLNLTDGKNRAQCNIIAHHGVGSGATAGGGLNRVQRFLNGFEADIALMGDNHQRALIPTGDKLYVEGSTLGSRCQWVGRTGSFQRGYVPGKPSYVTDMALNPSSLGHIELELTLTKCPHTRRHVVRIRGIQ